jgi:hypothetical protein
MSLFINGMRFKEKSIQQYIEEAIVEYRAHLFAERNKDAEDAEFRELE